MDYEDILKHFSYKHLPENQHYLCKTFKSLAEKLVKTTPRNPERSVALRKLLEAKDCALRSLS